MRVTRAIVKGLGGKMSVISCRVRSFTSMRYSAIRTSCTTSLLHSPCLFSAVRMQGVGTRVEVLLPTVLSVNTSAKQEDHMSVRPLRILVVEVP